MNQDQADPQQPAQLHYISGISFQSESTFDDIWARYIDICEYCAAEISYEDKRCPNCGQRIYASYYRYPQASSDLTIFWVLLLGLAQLSLILIMLNLLLRESLVATVWQGLMLIVLLVLVAGVFFRQFWAYIASLIFLIFAVAMIILGLAIGPTVDDVVAQALEGGFFQSLSDRPFIFVLGPLEDLLVPLQSLAVILALFFGIFRVGPDFERVKIRQIARIDRGLDDASQLYEAGNRYARQKKWASAILHYQKAVALAPVQFYYHRSLGQAYAQLGYYQRSLDVLESAHRSTMNTVLKLELDQIIAQVKQRQMQGTSPDNG
jgi:tetratricopeptide (TPR) repeat protein